MIRLFKWFAHAASALAGPEDYDDYDGYDAQGNLTYPLTETRAGR